jgi:hypothetical protein
MSSVSPGWYADPEGRPNERYWNGQAWTEQTRPLVGATTVGYGRPGMAGMPRNGMGIASLVMGILGIIILPIVFSVLAIIFGGVGIARANRGEATNKGMATTGMVLGIIGIVLGVIIGIWLFS